MKGLTLWQPWASLVGRGKRHETRSWATNYRGPIAIHAALRKPLGNELPAQTGHVISRILGDNWISEVPLGVIVAVAHLTDCIPAEKINTDPVDQLLGDYRKGRWAWELSDIVILSKPLPYKGRQKLWHVPSAIEHNLILRKKRGH